MTVPEGLLGRPRICIRYDGENGCPQFIARRICVDHDFEATNLSELVEELELIVNGN